MVRSAFVRAFAIFAILVAGASVASARRPADDDIFMAGIRAGSVCECPVKVGSCGCRIRL